MPPFKKLRRPGLGSTLTMPVGAAGAVALFTLAAGFLVYINTQNLLSASGRMEHAQEVLSSRQRASLLTERVHYRSRVYRLTREDDQLNRARTSVNSLLTTVAHIRSLAAVNPAHIRNVEILAAQANRLNWARRDFDPQSQVPEEKIQACQQTIGLMTDLELPLLQERNLGSQRKSFSSIATRIAFVGMLLVVLMVLFGFLLRDAVRRQGTSKQIRLANEQLGQTVRTLEDRAQEAAILMAARDQLQLCVNRQQVYDAAATGFWGLLSGTSGCWFMINHSRQMVEVVSSWGVTADEDFSPPESCRGLRSGHARSRRPGMSGIHCTHFIDNPPNDIDAGLSWPVETPSASFTLSARMTT
jgi:hypothetical protein